MRTRYEPYARLMAPMRSRLPAFRGRRRDQEVRERPSSYRVNLPSMNRPPPKAIQTIQFEDPIAIDPSILPPNMPGTSSTRCPPPTRNFCASWLAKNARAPRPKIAEVKLDDGDDIVVVEEDEIVVLSETTPQNKEEVEICEMSLPKKQLPGTSSKSPNVAAAQEVIHVSDDDDDVICLEEVQHQQMSARHMPSNFQYPEPTSSSSESDMEVIRINEGFSKECQIFKRSGRYWNEPLMGSRHSAARSTDITICSYNVLCQKTVERTLYLYRHLAQSSQFLEWDYRWNGLKLELPAFDADILGLQEVQADYYDEFFQPLMSGHGYEGAYKRKFGTHQKDDGCAMFWRPEKFKKLREDGVNYFVSATAISNRENVGQILTLQCRVTDEVLIIANTHLLFNEERGDVKLAQLAILFANIHKIRSELSHLNPAIVVMGDFNIEPHSKVYDFIVNGQLNVDKLPVRTMSGQSFRGGGALCSAALLLGQSPVGMDSIFLPPFGQRPLPDGHLRHPFKFVSAYHYGLPLTAYERRPISTFHRDAATPDFIFYTPDKNQQGVERLQLIRHYSLPTIDTLWNRAIPWPNQHVPSDHLPILAKFRLHSSK